MPMFISALKNVFFDHHCVHCGDVLVKDENVLCFVCNSELSNIKCNTEEVLFGVSSIDKLLSRYFYIKESPVQSVVESFKYDSIKGIGNFIAFEIKELIEEEEFDYFLYVPMHRKKEKERGFNQAEIITKSLSEELNIPVIHGLKRTGHLSSQTKESKYKRYNRTISLYEYDGHIDLKGKRVAVIDDVFTTGATLSACAQSIKDQFDCHITVVTYALRPDSDQF